MRSNAKALVRAHHPRHHTTMSDMPKIIAEAKSLRAEGMAKLVQELQPTNKQLRGLFITSILAVNASVIMWLLDETKVTTDWIPRNRMAALIRPMMSDEFAGPSLMRLLVTRGLDLNLKLPAIVSEPSRPRETIMDRLRAAGLVKEAAWLDRFV
jgi:hypothetical protein